MDADVIVVGAGLAGLVATAELADAGKRVILVDQEPEQSLGGQAHWSLGGLFLVNSPEQRHLGIRDSLELAWQDWQATAGFDRKVDAWPREWARAYVEWAAGEKRSWLHAKGVRWLPIVGWAERGGYGANGPGNSVPRFHLTWGTGPGVVAPFAKRVQEAAKDGLVDLRFRHRVDELLITDGAVSGVAGAVLEPSSVERGQASSRTVVDDFELYAGAVVVASGGIGGNFDAIRANWPASLGTPPENMIAGVPAHVDGRMLGISESIGGNLINRDRMWHYVEGIKNHSPVWPDHGIRILPGPSSLWLDATGKRLPDPLYPGFDTLGTLEHLRKTGYDYSWFILNKRIIGKEFALSGSEQNPDWTGKSLRETVRQRVLSGAPDPVQAFLDKGEDFVTAHNVADLVFKMNALAGSNLLDADAIEEEVRHRDAEIGNPYSADNQIAEIHRARKYLGDKIVRVTPPHKLLDKKAGPLIGVRLHIISRKTLGGLETDLSSRVLKADGKPLPGLYAAGEAAGFGGGGVHGYRALEGTFLGGCLFSGRNAGRALAKAL